jgi:hypothetical protein
MSSAHGNAAGRVFDLAKDTVRVTPLSVCSVTHAAEPKLQSHDGSAVRIERPKMKGILLKIDSRET